MVVANIAKVAVLVYNAYVRLFVLLIHLKKTGGF